MDFIEMQIIHRDLAPLNFPATNFVTVLPAPLEFILGNLAKIGLFIANHNIG